MNGLIQVSIAMARFPIQAFEDSKKLALEKNKEVLYLFVICTVKYQRNILYLLSSNNKVFMTIATFHHLMPYLHDHAKSYRSFEYDIYGYKFRCIVDEPFYAEQKQYIDHYIHPSQSSYTEKQQRNFHLIVDTSLFFAYKTLQFTNTGSIKEISKGIFYREISYDEGMLFLPSDNSVTLCKEDDPILVMLEDNNLFIIIKEGVTSYPKYMLRYIRDTLVRWNEEHASYLFHAGGVVYQNQGIIFLGEKGAGKTTSVMCMLDTETALCFLANDRIMISEQGMLSYVPLSIRISHSTIKHTKKLKRFYQSNLLSRANLPPELPASGEEKIEFTPQEVGNAYNCSLIDQAPLKLIVIPYFSLNHETLSMERYSVNTAIDIMKACCYTPRDERWKDTWITERIQSDDNLRKSRDKFIENLISSQPTYVMQFGPHNSSKEIKSNIIQLLK